MLCSNMEVQGALSDALKKSTLTISRYVKRNDENGPLTTEKAINVIETKLNLKREQILTAA